jgi:phospholipase D1/2
VNSPNSIAVAQDTVFEEGRNCRRVADAHRVGFVIDGDDYFKEFMQAAERAQESIIILAWDFNSRARLRFDNGDDDPPAELGDFLNYLVKRRHGLHIYILDWDFPMIYAKDREAPIMVRLGWGWKPHRNVHLRLDNTHPPGGSHHQKIVVIDDAIAFCGGLDLTCQRWDTNEHAPCEPHRVVGGKPYPPFHDLMVAVDGEAARELGRIARKRWCCAAGDEIPMVHATDDPWPPEFKPDLYDIAVAIATTSPDAAPHEEAREIEALYLDMIARAKRYIYIENQYFTAHKIGNALEARLREAGGPEIVVVTRLLSHGWLEEATMGVLRNKMVERLRAADAHGRFNVYYPEMPGLAEGTCIDVHSKMMTVDDQWLRIGSANMNNRSMGLDTECDVAIEARDNAEIARTIRSLRDRLLAEHLGVPLEAVTREVAAKGSIAGAITALQKEGRTLKPLPIEHYSDITISIAELTDPERAVGVDKLMAQFSFSAEFPSVARPLRTVLFYSALAVGLTALWQFTPLRRILRIDRWESASARLLKKLRR